MRKYFNICVAVAILLLTAIGRPAVFAQETLIIDAGHYSNVLGEARNYRVFLPSDYHEQPEKKYPVVYFYHGWSQRYFGSIEAKAEQDPGLSDEEKIAALVSKYGVMVVKPDGYNRRLSDPYNLRPYNIGPVETYRQFPLYFPELVEHIDANYRTFADRSQRAITGYSMGGFMSFWIAGKYPHLVSSAGSFCGSPEFFVGPIDFPVEYFHGDMYGNYEGLKLRLHYGEDDFIRAYHRDIDAIWKPVMDNYESRQYPGKHDLSGLEDMFKFFVSAFEDPADPPARWNHIDVYPKFSVWDYVVNSDRTLPGFTVLENVDKEGFRVSVRSEFPDGEALPMVSLSVTTAPLYEQNTEYQLSIFNLKSGKKTQGKARSDDRGRLKIELNGGVHEVGIYKVGGMPNIALTAAVVDSGNYPTTHTHTPLQLDLVNKGGSRAEGITASLWSDGPLELEEKTVLVGDIEVLERASISPFVFYIPSDSIRTQKFTLKLKDENHQEWEESFVLDFKPKSNPLPDFEIADGREVTFQKGGKDTVTMTLGVGNGDGIPNPGETVVVLVKDEGLNRLTTLHSLSSWVDLSSSHTRISDSWTQFDHVGGSFKYSRPLLSSACSPGTEITFYAEYWLSDYPDHPIRGGEITLQISGLDKVAPQLDWARVTGDNIFQAKFYDGDDIAHAEVSLKSEEKPEKTYNFTLYDNGESGDKAAEDQVFSREINVTDFGLYQAEVTVSDSQGNKGVFTIADKFIFHEIDLQH